MFRFLRSHIHPTGDLKTADIRDFFEYTPSLRHGFPQLVSSLAYDYILGLMAVGTSDGQVRIFGAENVEWSSTTPRDTPVAQMYFAAGLGTLIVLCSDQSFHKFQVAGDIIERTTAPAEDRLKRITCCEMQNVQDPSSARLFIGTITGNIFGLCAISLEFSEVILFEEAILKSINPSKDVGRSANQIMMNPVDATQVLIAFNSHIIVHYNLLSSEVLHYWTIQQTITSISWHVDGEYFICAHSDGSLGTWKICCAEPVEQSMIPFGPFPCTSISKVRWICASSHPLPIKLYTGGMPRASYGDRYTLTAMREDRMVVFDFGSAVVDFIVVPSLQSEAGADYKNCLALMILCEQELVCIDLTDVSWPLLNLPYLQPIHSSQITCVVHYSNIEEHVWKALIKASEAQNRLSAKCKWPIHAGGNVQTPVLCASTNAEKRQLLITGHEDGTVKFWSTGSVSLRYLLKINTAKEFEGCFSIGADIDRAECGSENSSVEASNNGTSDEDSNEVTDWPPFRKVGTYDPFCDDPRLAVQKVYFDVTSGQLVIGGRAGHVIVYDLDDEPSAVLTIMRTEYEVAEKSKLPSNINQQALPLRQSPLAYSVGYQPFKTDQNRRHIAKISLIELFNSLIALSTLITHNSMNCLVQLRPPVAITAVASLRSRNLLAFGCEYGFVMCDLKSQATLISTCLLTLKELADTSTLSRFKSMKKSIRQSFRRKKKIPQGEIHSIEPACSVANENGNELRPVERQIISRAEAPVNIGDPPVSAVRVLRFFRTNILSAASLTDSLWIGTNGGVIFAYAISDDALKPEDVCVLVKEVQLQHRAPVIDFTCAAVDGSHLIKGLTGTERLIIYTEEQIKTFALPTMKPTRFRYKFTGMEGSRIRKAQLLTLRSATITFRAPSFMAYSTECSSLSYPQHEWNNTKSASVFYTSKPILQVIVISIAKFQASDIEGIASAALSENGEIFFLRPGASEFQRASLTTMQHNNLTSPLKDSKFPKT
uniref:Lethal giant larvae homologue 2 domain-containing protein n=1 Tax=Setaria digitata TaxID=48799 RepID=A0A915Q1R0_9BILA